MSQSHLLRTLLAPSPFFQPGTEENGNTAFSSAVSYHLSVWLADSLLYYTFLGAVYSTGCEGKLPLPRFPFKESRGKSLEARVIAKIPGRQIFQTAEANINNAGHNYTGGGGRDRRDLSVAFSFCNDAQKPLLVPGGT